MVYVSDSAELKIETCLDKNTFKQKPKQQDAGVISKSIAKCRTKLTLRQLVVGIGQGRTFTLAAGFKENSRKARNFLGVQIFAADIDNNNLSYEELKAKIDCFELPASVVYESFSSSPTARKWRVMFISETPVTIPALALGILRKIRTHFESDRSMVDLARIVYGTTPEKIAYSKEAFFDPLSVKIVEPVKKSKILRSISLPEDNSNKELSKAIKVLIFESKPRFYRGDYPRYLTIWHTARCFASTGKMSRKHISGQIMYWISDPKSKFADYDRTEDQIQRLIDNAIDWVLDLE